MKPNGRDAWNPSDDLCSLFPSALWALAKTSKTILTMILDPRDVILYANDALTSMGEQSVRGRPLGEVASLEYRSPIQHTSDLAQGDPFILESLVDSVPSAFRCVLFRQQMLSAVVGEVMTDLAHSEGKGAAPSESLQQSIVSMVDSMGQSMREVIEDNCAKDQRLHHAHEHIESILDHLHENQEPQTLALLSPRELDVLRLLAEGLSSKAIAGRLYVSTRTIDNHRARLLRKLHADGAADLIRIAVHYVLGEMLEEVLDEADQT